MAKKLNTRAEEGEREGEKENMARSTSELLFFALLMTSLKSMVRSTCELARLASVQRTFNDNGQ